MNIVKARARKALCKNARLMAMGKYIAKRLLSSLAVMAIVSFMAFAALELIPGNAAMVAAGTEGSSSSVASIAAELGLDRSFGERILLYYRNLLSFDFGVSSYFGESVSMLIRQRIGVTFSLAFFSVLLSFSFSVALGSAAALRKGKLIDTFSRSVVQLFSSIPSFWLSLLFLIVFSSMLHVVNVGDYIPPYVSISGYLSSIILPVIVLAIGETGPLLRLVRASMLQVKDEDWYRMGKVRGIPRMRLAAAYALRYALPGPLTLAGSELAKLLGGTAIVESIFALPGLGRLFLTAVEMRDIPLVEGIVIFVSFLVVIMNLLTDLALFLSNPSMKKAGGVMI